MSVPLADFCAYIDSLLNSASFQDYCPNGLQLEGAAEVRSFATAVTASLAVIEQAVEAEVQLLLVHHGLFWQKEPYEITGTKRKKIQLLIDNNISLLAYHLPLDAHPRYGNNWKAAKELGWKRLQPFSYIHGIPIGVKGVFPRIGREALQKQLESYYGHPAQVAFGGASHISSGAIVSGGAHKVAAEAAAHQLDCFITGSVDEPVWHIAQEERINFFALGHSATERIGPKALGQHLGRHFKLKSIFIEENNPF